MRLFFLSILYRIITILGKDNQRIAEKIIFLNNCDILSHNYNIRPENILVILPHCVQAVECKIRITFNPEYCRRCGKCNVGKLVGYSEKMKFRLAIATGGTLARKIIRETSPEAIIAVACHRDLMEGILDIRKIPVLGLLNRIGKNGPCVGTDFDPDKVMEYIDFFTSNVN